MSICHIAFEHVDLHTRTLMIMIMDLFYHLTYLHVYGVNVKFDSPGTSSYRVSYQAVGDEAYLKKYQFPHSNNLQN